MFHKYLKSITRVWLVSFLILLYQLQESDLLVSWIFNINCCTSFWIVNFMSLICKFHESFTSMTWVCLVGSKIILKQIHESDSSVSWIFYINYMSLVRQCQEPVSSDSLSDLLDFLSSECLVYSTSVAWICQFYCIESV